MRGTDQVVVHWCDLEPEGRLSLGVEDTLRQIIRCQPIEYAIAIADSALSAGKHRGALISRADWHRIVAEFPGLRSQLLEVDPRAGSGTESVFRIRLLLRCGLRPRSQVRIDGVGRVDFVLGKRLVIEVDSEEFHANPAQYHADRRRDALLSARGYRVLRFTYQQVLFDWPQVERAVLAAVARGDQH